MMYESYKCRVNLVIVHIYFKIYTLVTKIAHVSGLPPHIERLALCCQDITQPIFLAYQFECWVVMKMVLLVTIISAINVGFIVGVVGVQGASKIIFYLIAS